MREVKAREAATAMVVASVPELVKRISSRPEGEKRVVIWRRLETMYRDMVTLEFVKFEYLGKKARC